MTKTQPSEKPCLEKQNKQTKKPHPPQRSGTACRSPLTPSLSEFNPDTLFFDPQTGHNRQRILPQSQNSRNCSFVFKILFAVGHVIELETMDKLCDQDSLGHLCLSEVVRILSSFTQMQELKVMSFSCSKSYIGLLH